MTIADYDATAALNATINGYPISDGLGSAGHDEAFRQLLADIAAELSPTADATFATVTATTKGTFGGVDIWNGTQGSTGSIFVGTDAPAETGGDNIAIGFTAGRNLGSGSDNTILGRASGASLITGSNNTIVGHDAESSSTSVSNEITLGDANVTAFRIPGLSSTSMGATAWDAAVSATASYTTAEETKLAGVETGATADQTGAEIKTAYEAEANTNAFTDADHTKLDGIETAADVTDTTNVTAAGALMDSELTDIAAVKALNQGVATTDSPKFNNWAIIDTGTIGDDAVFSFDVADYLSTAFFPFTMRVSGSYVNTYGDVRARASATNASTTGINLGGQLEVTTGVLSGTTGNDAHMTISTHTDNKIYVENRLGGNASVTIVLIGSA